MKQEFQTSSWWEGEVKRFHYVTDIVISLPFKIYVKFTTLIHEYSFSKFLFFGLLFFYFRKKNYTLYGKKKIQIIQARTKKKKNVKLKFFKH